MEQHLSQVGRDGSCRGLSSPLAAAELRRRIAGPEQPGRSVKTSEDGRQSLPARAAAVRGDEYQYAVVWYWVTRALAADLDIESVSVEDAGAGSFDDLVIERRDAGPRYMQIKSSNTARTVIDESWLCSAATQRGRSPLQHFYDTWARLRSPGAEFVLLTNRGLDHTDPVLQLRDNRSGRIERLDGYGPRSAAGQARARWAAHLHVSETELLDFLAELQIDTEGAERSWRDRARHTMALAGLRADDDAVVRGIAIVREWVMSGAGPRRTDDIRGEVVSTGLVARRATGPSSRTTAATSDSERASDYVARMREASQRRTLQRLRSTGLTGEALDRARSAMPAALPEALARETRGRFAVIEGELGLGKSEVGELWHRLALDRYEHEEGSAPLPRWVRAQDFGDENMARLCDEQTAAGAMPIDLIVDGLDDLSDNRANAYLRRARDIADAHPDSHVLLTTRPGSLRLDQEEIVRPELLDLSVAIELVRYVAGQHHRPGSGWSTSLEDAVRRPLFALLAAAAMAAGTSVSSPVQLMNWLVGRALDWPPGAAGAVDATTLATLKQTASLATTAGGGVDLREVGGWQDQQRLLASHLVVVDDDVLVFPLPVIRQWLAAQALIDDDTAVEVGLSSVRGFAAWRYAYAMALEAGPKRTVDALMTTATRWNPAAARWLVHETVRGWFSLSRGPVEDDFGRRLLTAFDEIDAGVGDVASVVVPRHPDGRRLPLAFRATDDRVSYTWKAEPEPDGARLVDFDDSVLSLSPSKYRGGGAMAAVARVPLAPWKLAYDFLDRRLQSTIGEAKLPYLTEGSPAVDEWRWRAARSLTGAPNGLARRSVLGDSVRTRIAELLGRVGEVEDAVFDLTGRIVLTAGELRELDHWIETTPSLRVIEYPWPLPDRDPRLGGGFVWSLYSDEALRSLTIEIHRAALTIYDEIIDRWFGTFRSLMGYALVGPSELRGFLVIPSDGGMAGHPYLVVSRLPRQRHEEAPVSLNVTHEHVLGSASSLEAFERSLEERIAAWMDRNPGVADFAHFPTQSATLEVFTAAPATKIAHEWVCDDLQRLGFDVRFKGSQRLD